jgi:flagellar motor protein MotB
MSKKQEATPGNRKTRKLIIKEKTALPEPLNRIDPVDVDANTPNPLADAILGYDYSAQLPKQEVHFAPSTKAAPKLVLRKSEKPKIELAKSVQDRRCTNGERWSEELQKCVKNVLDITVGDVVLHPTNKPGRIIYQPTMDELPRLRELKKMTGKKLDEYVKQVGAKKTGRLTDDLILDILAFERESALLKPAKPLHQKMAQKAAEEREQQEEEQEEEQILSEEGIAPALVPATPEESVFSSELTPTETKLLKQTETIPQVDSVDEPFDDSPLPSVEIELTDSGKELQEKVGVMPLNAESKEYNQFLFEKEKLENQDAKENDEFETLYPTLNDPNFNKKIAQRKEFFDTKFDGTVYNIKEQAELLCNADFELTPHQLFVKNFLSMQTPYNCLLLFHGLGTGKTCSAIGIAEEMRNYMKQVGLVKRKDKIIVVASPNVQHNFRLQLFDERKLKRDGNVWNLNTCIGNALLSEVNPTFLQGLSKDRISAQINALINQYYEFMGYIELANYIKRNINVDDAETTLTPSEKKQLQIKKIRKLFNNRLIIIDEVHNIKLMQDTKQSKTTTLLMQVVRYALNVRVLLLSATPMYNSFKEIIWLTNLMNMVDNRSSIREDDVFDKNGDFLEPRETKDGIQLEGGKELLMRKLTGYISYVRGENPFTFPYRIYPSLFSVENSFENPENKYPMKQMNNRAIETPLQHVPVFLTKIGEYQERVYYYIITNLRNKSFNTTNLYGEEREMPSFENMDSFGYTLLTDPIEALNIAYPNVVFDAKYADMKLKEEEVKSKQQVVAPPPVPVVAVSSEPFVPENESKIEEFSPEENEEVRRNAVAAGIEMPAEEVKTSETSPSPSPSLETSQTSSSVESVAETPGQGEVLQEPPNANAVPPNSVAEIAPTALPEPMGNAPVSNALPVPAPVVVEAPPNALPVPVGNETAPSSVEGNESLSLTEQPQLPQQQLQQQPQQQLQQQPQEQPQEQPQLQLQEQLQEQPQLQEQEQPQQQLQQPKLQVGGADSESETSAEPDLPQDNSDMIKQLIGKQGLSNVITYKTMRTPHTLKYGFEYKPDVLANPDYGRIFQPSNIGKYSGKIAKICDCVRNSKGIIIIYSQYIDAGVVPLALALEEMGFSRYGSANYTKSLFETPPTESVDSVTMKPRTQYIQENGDSVEGFKPAKYVMITGDKHYSPNNLADIKYVTNPNNKNGELVKVILITKAAAEGLDFKNIRQIHILEPWYNMNRVEQIIGRGVRNLSHCQLPFEDRNVEIYLHATLPVQVEEEPADLYVYRYAESKATQIGKITRLLKEVAVDCILNIGQTNFTMDKLNALVENQNIKITISSTNPDTREQVELDYKIGDKPFTDICDYMDNCSFTCSPTAEIAEEDVNKNSYSEEYAKMNYAPIVKRIRQLFKEQSFYKRDYLFAAIQINKKFPEEHIDYALSKLVDSQNEIIVDKYGRSGFLINAGEHYAFQPLELTDQHASVYERTVPIPFKHDVLNMELPLTKEKEKDTVKEKDIDAAGEERTPYQRILSLLQENLDMVDAEIENAKQQKQLESGEIDWFKHLGRVHVLLTEIHDITVEDIRKYAVFHYLDTCSLEDRLILIFELYKDDEQLVEALTLSTCKLYFDEKIVTGRSTRGIILANANITTLYVQNVETKEWIVALPTQIRDFSSAIQTKFTIPRERVNQFVGFMHLFKSGDMVFKTKDLSETRNNKGAKCGSAAKKDIIKRLNIILEENPDLVEGAETYQYNDENSEFIYRSGLCVILEVLMRHYTSSVNSGGRYWFLDVEKTLANKLIKL